MEESGRARSESAILPDGQLPIHSQFRRVEKRPILQAEQPSCRHSHPGRNIPRAVPDAPDIDVRFPQDGPLANFGKTLPQGPGAELP